MRARTLWVLCILPLWAGCMLSRDAMKLPPEPILARGPLVMHGDAPLLESSLVHDLTALRHELAAQLQLPPSSTPVHLYVFEAGDRFDSFVQREYPDFPNRRAFFVAEGGVLKVYAGRGAHLAEDLRHEMTHGYLHGMIPQIPLWLDEGLAEFFEVPSDQRGLNSPHVALLLERRQIGQWAPDLRRLEQLGSSRDMTQQDYAESWAWAHFLLTSSPQRREWLCHYCASLPAPSPVPPLSATLAAVDPGAGQALAEHLQQRYSCGGGCQRETRSAPGRSHAHRRPGAGAPSNAVNAVNRMIRSAGCDPLLEFQGQLDCLESQSLQHALHGLIVRRNLNFDHRDAIEHSQSKGFAEQKNGERLTIEGRWQFEMSHSLRMDTPTAG